MMRLDDRIDELWSELPWGVMSEDRRNWFRRRKEVMKKRAKVLEDLADSIIAVVGSTDIR